MSAPVDHRHFVADMAWLADASDEVPVSALMARHAFNRTSRSCLGGQSAAGWPHRADEIPIFRLARPRRFALGRAWGTPGPLIQATGATPTPLRYGDFVHRTALSVARLPPAAMRRRRAWRAAGAR